MAEYSDIAESSSMAGASNDASVIPTEIVTRLRGPAHGTIGKVVNRKVVLVTGGEYKRVLRMKEYEKARKDLKMYLANENIQHPVAVYLKGDPNFPDLYHPDSGIHRNIIRTTLDNREFYYLPGFIGSRSEHFWSQLKEGEPGSESYALASHPPGSDPTKKAIELDKVTKSRGEWSGSTDESIPLIWVPRYGPRYDPISGTPTYQTKSLIAAEERIEKGTEHHPTSNAILKAEKKGKDPDDLLFNKDGSIKMKNMEHHVGGWMNKKLNIVYSGEGTEDTWLVTPEKIDPQEKKKPDFIVETALEEDGKWEFLYHIGVEVKALNSGFSIKRTIDQLLDTVFDPFFSQMESFIIVQVGFKIAFFEYYNYRTDLDEQGSESFKGCVSLTDHLEYASMVYPAPLHHTECGEGLEKIGGRPASDYRVPSVFDIRIHKKEIDFLFHYMKKNYPRLYTG